MIQKHAVIPCGTTHRCRTTSKRPTGSGCVCANASGFSITSAFLSSARRHSLQKTKKGLRASGMPLKKLNELEQDEQAVLVYQDEVHFQVATSVTRNL